MKIPNDNEVEGAASSSSGDSSGAGLNVEGGEEPGDFSEYMWMENQEEFDRQVLQELEEVVGRTPSPPRDPGDFSEFMWMENEEEFDKEFLRQLEEEALMKQCIESMLDDEENGQKTPELIRDFTNLRVQDSNEIAKKSTLNPNAAEFVPQVALPSK